MNDIYEMYKIVPNSREEFAFILGQAVYGDFEFLVDDTRITFVNIYKDDLQVILDNLEEEREFFKRLK